MQWTDSSFFYAVVVHGTGEAQTVTELGQHSNPFLAFEDIKRRYDGLTFIRNERGVSCYPHKALRYFERRAKDRGRK